jgi:Na+-translocating ferredoxin:NAD+ oxidoreductase subunit G
MNQFLQTAKILALVCFVSALLLSLMNILTRGAIAETNQKKKDAARAQVLPAAEYAPGIFLPGDDPSAALSALFGKPVPDANAEVGTNYLAALDENGETIGYIFDVIAPGGYGGSIELVVGVTVFPNETWGSAHIADYRVISSAETPGLGKSAEHNLHAFFTNSPLAERKGVFDIVPADRQRDSISGATITSLAIKNALASALQRASLIIKRDWVNLNFPQEILGIIPNAQRFVPIPNLRQGAAREALETTWYDQPSGYLVKVFLQDARQKRVGLGGFVVGSRRLYAARLFAMPEEAGAPFVPDPDLRAGLFYGIDITTWYSNTVLTSLESNFAFALKEGYDLLHKGGKLP